MTFDDQLSDGVAQGAPADAGSHAFVADIADALICNVCGEHLLTHPDRIRMAVEYIVDFVEQAGRFEGRGKDRHLTLQDVLSFGEGTPMPAMDYMAISVGGILRGTASYRQRAEPGEARPPEPQ
jgi:hypothetical protein